MAVMPAPFWISNNLAPLEFAKAGAQLGLERNRLNLEAARLSQTAQEAADRRLLAMAQFREDQRQARERMNLSYAQLATDREATMARLNLAAATQAHALDLKGLQYESLDRYRQFEAQSAAQRLIDTQQRMQQTAASDAEKLELRRALGAQAYQMGQDKLAQAEAASQRLNARGWAGLDLRRMSTEDLIKSRALGNLRADREFKRREAADSLRGTEAMLRILEGEDKNDPASFFSKEPAATSPMHPAWERSQARRTQIDALKNRMQQHQSTLDTLDTDDTGDADLTFTRDASGNLIMQKPTKKTSAVAPPAGPSLMQRAIAATPNPIALGAQAARRLPQAWEALQNFASLDWLRENQPQAITNAPAAGPLGLEGSSF